MLNIKKIGITIALGAVLTVGFFFHQKKDTPIVTITPVEKMSTTSVQGTTTIVTSTDQTSVRKMSPVLTQLVDLIRGCKVKGIQYAPTRGAAGDAGIDYVELKDGSRLGGVGSIVKDDMPILEKEICSVKDKCRVQLGFTMLD